MVVELVDAELRQACDFPGERLLSLRINALPYFLPSLIGRTFPLFIDLLLELLRHCRDRNGQLQNDRRFTLRRVRRQLPLGRQLGIFLLRFLQLGLQVRQFLSQLGFFTGRGSSLPLYGVQNCGSS